MQKILLLLIAAAAYAQVYNNFSILISQQERQIFEFIDEKSSNYDYFNISIGDETIEEISADLSDDGTQKSVTSVGWKSWGFIPKGRKKEDFAYYSEQLGFTKPKELSEIVRDANGRSIQYQFINYYFENGNTQPQKVVKFLRIRYTVQPCRCPDQCSFKLKISSIRELISQFTIESTADKVEIFRRIKAAVP